MGLEHHCDIKLIISLAGNTLALNTCPIASVCLCLDIVSAHTFHITDRYGQTVIRP